MKRDEMRSERRVKLRKMETENQLPWTTSDSSGAFSYDQSQHENMHTLRRK